MSNLFFCNGCNKVQSTSTNGNRVVCLSCGYTLILTITPRISNQVKSSPSGRPTKTKLHQQAYGPLTQRIQTGKEEGLLNSPVSDGTTEQAPELGKCLHVRSRMSKASKYKQRDNKQTLKTFGRKKGRTTGRRRKS